MLRNLRVLCLLGSDVCPLNWLVCTQRLNWCLVYIHCYLEAGSTVEIDKVAV